MLSYNGLLLLIKFHGYCYHVRHLLIILKKEIEHDTRVILLLRENDVRLSLG